MIPTLRILGCRGVPAGHGGFETFAERLSLYLVAKGWRVVVYCQRDSGFAISKDHWQGVERVWMPSLLKGAAGTIIFDFLANVHAALSGGACLTLGYNTAIFAGLLRLRGRVNLINMDGLEWTREKWGPMARLWLWCNERLGCWLGNYLIADHPEIEIHLRTRVPQKKITVIPYGADVSIDASEAHVQALGVEPHRFFSLIARPEPENSVLEIVQGFSQKHRGAKLLVLGRYDPERNRYHRAVVEAAGSEVVFAGAIYDRQVVGSIRKLSIAYAHGHQVGGTNPSLVEAMSAGNPVIAHDNRFNRWVAGAGSLYFKDSGDFSDCVDRILEDPDFAAKMGDFGRRRFESEFTWESVLSKYEALLTEYRSNS